MPRPRRTDWTSTVTPATGHRRGVQPASGTDSSRSPNGWRRSAVARSPTACDYVPGFARRPRPAMVRAGGRRASDRPRRLAQARRTSTCTSPTTRRGGFRWRSRAGDGRRGAVTACRCRRCWRRRRARRPRLHARRDRRVGRARRRARRRARARGRSAGARATPCGARRPLRDPDDASGRHVQFFVDNSLVPGHSETMPFVEALVGRSPLFRLTVDPHRRRRGGHEAWTARRSWPSSCVSRGLADTKASKPRSIVTSCARFASAPAAGRGVAGGRRTGGLCAGDGYVVGWRTLAADAGALPTPDTTSSSPHPTYYLDMASTTTDDAEGVVGRQHHSNSVRVRSRARLVRLRRPTARSRPACGPRPCTARTLFEFLFPRLDAIAERGWTAGSRAVPVARSIRRRSLSTALPPQRRPRGQAWLVGSKCRHRGAVELSASGRTTDDPRTSTLVSRDRSARPTTTPRWSRLADPAPPNWRGVRDQAERLLTGASRPRRSGACVDESTAASTGVARRRHCVLSPRMLADIEGAESSIHINQFGFKPGVVGDQFADGPGRKASRWVSRPARRRHARQRSTRARAICTRGSTAPASEVCVVRHEARAAVGPLGGDGALRWNLAGSATSTTAR